MGMRPGAAPADVAPRQPEVDDGGDVVGAVLVLRDPHRPHEDRRARGRVHAGEALHVGARRARLPFEIGEGLALELLEQLVEAFGVLAHEPSVDPTVGQQHLQHAVEERDVATGVHAEELVGHLRAEHRALDVARHPVAIEPRLAHAG